MKTLKKTAIAATVFSIALGGSAIAASDHRGEQGQGAGATDGEQHRMHGGMHRHGQGMEERLSTLKTELKLTPGQETAWQTFESAVRNQRTAYAQHKPPQAGTDPLENRIAHMEQRLTAMKAVAKARKELYKVLNADQKAAADRFFQRPHA